MSAHRQVVVVDKNWTLEQAQAAHQRVISANPEMWNSPETPLFQWSALHRIDDLQRQFESGDTVALLEAIYNCAMHDLTMPEWVQRAYIDRYRQIIHFEAASWDEVFGKPHRKGLRLADARRRRELRTPIFLRIREIRRAEPDTAIGDGLFERVAEEFGIGKTLVNELWYEAERWWRDLLKAIPGK